MTYRQKRLMMHICYQLWKKHREKRPCGPSCIKLTGEALKHIQLNLGTNVYVFKSMSGSGERDEDFTIRRRCTQNGGRSDHGSSSNYDERKVLLM